MRRPLWAAVALALGVIAAELAASLLNYAGTAPRDKAVLARRLLIGAGLLLALSWSTAIYAQLSGERFAAAYANNPQGRASATIFSEKDLKLTGSGIIAKRIPSDTEDSSTNMRISTANLQQLSLVCILTTGTQIH